MNQAQWIEDNAGLRLEVDGQSVPVVTANTVVVGTGAAVALLGFLYYAGVGYLHGVLGYLMGSLVRSKQDRFEFMLA